MLDFTFYSPTEFVFGRDTQTRAGELARRYGATKVMIVSGGGSAERSGLLGQVRDSLDKARNPVYRTERHTAQPTRHRGV